MGSNSKLEYWFLLTKIAVMILGVMIEDGVGSVVPALGQLVVDLVACWWWDRSSTYLLKPVNFPKSNFPSGLDFGFSNSPKVPPNCPKFAQSPIFYIVNYYGGNWKIQKSPNCPKFSQFTQKSPNFQSRRQSPISKVKNYPT